MNKKLLLNKKGNFADVPVFLLSALAIGMGLVITLLFINQFQSNINSNDNIPNVTQTGITSYYNLLETTSDFILPILYLGFLGFSIFSARLIPSSPKFLIIGVLAMILLPLTAMMVENIWDGFIQQTLIAQQANGMIFTPFLLNNMVFAILFYTIIVNIALYSKEDKL